MTTRKMLEDLESDLADLLRGEAKLPFVSQDMRARIRASTLAQIGGLTAINPKPSSSPGETPSGGDASSAAASAEPTEPATPSSSPSPPTSTGAAPSAHASTAATASTAAPAASASTAATAAGSGGLDVLSNSATSLGRVVLQAPLGSVPGVLALVTALTTGAIVGTTVGPSVRKALTVSSAGAPTQADTSSLPTTSKAPPVVIATPSTAPATESSAPPTSTPTGRTAPVLPNAAASRTEPTAKTTTERTAAERAATGPAATTRPRTRRRLDAQNEGLEAEPTRGDPKSSGRATSLVREQALMDRARTALARGLFAEALDAVHEHEHLFPNGVFAAERSGIEVLALDRKGDRDAARAAAQVFLIRYPSALMTDAVRSIAEKR